TVRRADDRTHSGVAACGEPEDGGAAGADGVDRGDSGGKSVAGGVRSTASNLGFAGERRFADGSCFHVFNDKGVKRARIDSCSEFWLFVSGIWGRKPSLLPSPVFT